MTEPAYVYIIAAGDLVKIGVAKNPKQRLKSLRTGCPDTPRLVATRLLPSRKEAFSLELALHRRFYRRRANGEWFRVGVTTARAALNSIHFHREGEDVRGIIDALFAPNPQLKML